MSQTRYFFTSVSSTRGSNSIGTKYLVGSLNVTLPPGGTFIAERVSVALQGQALTVFNGKSARGIDLVEVTTVGVTIIPPTDPDHPNSLKIDYQARIKDLNDTIMQVDVLQDIRFAVLAQYTTP